MSLLPLNSTYFYLYRRTHIEFGTGGTPQRRTILSAERPEDRQFDIYYTAVATGYGSTGVWDFMENTGKARRRERMIRYISNLVIEQVKLDS